MQHNAALCTKLHNAASHLRASEASRQLCSAGCSHSRAGSTAQHAISPSRAARRLLPRTHTHTHARTHTHTHTHAHAHTHTHDGVAPAHSGARASKLLYFSADIACSKIILKKYPKFLECNEIIVSLQGLLVAHALRRSSVGSAPLGNKRPEALVIIVIYYNIIYIYDIYCFEEELCRKRAAVSGSARGPASSSSRNI